MPMIIKSFFIGLFENHSRLAYFKLLEHLRLSSLYGLDKINSLRIFASLSLRVIAAKCGWGYSAEWDNASLNLKTQPCSQLRQPVHSVPQNTGNRHRLWAARARERGPENSLCKHKLSLLHLLSASDHTMDGCPKTSAQDVTTRVRDSLPQARNWTCIGGYTKA